MKRLPGKTVRNKNEVSQTLDVSKILGVDVSENPRIVQEFGQAVLDRIESRTVEENKDVSGNKFNSYKDSYIDSEEFDEFGKSPSDINLTLTGDMMDSIDFTSSSDVIRVAVDESEAGKAFGNISGIRGKVKKSINPRDWFGVSSKDLKEIKNQFKDDIKRIKEDSQPTARQLLNLAAVETVDQRSPRSVFNSVFADLIEVDNGES